MLTWFWAYGTKHEHEHVLDYYGYQKNVWECSNFMCYL